MGILAKQTKQQKALRYFTMGLTAKETGKLLDLSQRTVEGYITRGAWKKSTDDRPLQEKALSLVNNGNSYAETAKILGISKSTVYNYIVKEKQNKTVNFEHSEG